jgi:hypothetical protein
LATNLKIIEKEWSYVMTPEDPGDGREGPDVTLEVDVVSLFDVIQSQGAA